MRTNSQALVSSLVVVSTLGCVPEFDDDTSRIAAPRVIAVQASPAEVMERQDESTLLTALVAAPHGSVAPLIEWSLCLDRKPLSELGPVSQRCLASASPGSEIAEPIGSGESVRAPIPEDACQLFGPQRPDPKPGEPAGRPVDPDPTGGFYQPVLAWTGDSAVLGSIRLGCSLRDIEFNRRYRKNENPELVSVEAVRADGSVLSFEEGAEVSLAPGERVTLRAAWNECPAVDACGDGICGPDEDQTQCIGEGDDCAQPKGCTGAERYAYFDALEQVVSDRWEALTVSWYSTDGSFDAPRTDRVDGSDGTSRTANGYTGPGAGVARLWAVVRDDRGGVSWRALSVSVSTKGP